jgi:hypothetical protein
VLDYYVLIDGYHVWLLMMTSQVARWIGRESGSVA